MPRNRKQRDLGDDTWPLASSTLADHLSAQVARCGLPEWRGGFARLGNCLRADLREEMCVEGNQALAPVLRIPAQCGELHPGLCRTDDAGIFQAAMALAGSLLAEAKSLGIGGFVGVHTCCYSRVFCTSMVRLRDPPIVVLAECRLSADDPNVLTFALQQGELVFETSYAIARDATYACRGLHEIAMTHFRVQSDRQTPLQVEIVGRDHKILQVGRDAEGRVGGGWGEDGDDRPGGHGRGDGDGRGGRDARGAGGDLLGMFGVVENRGAVGRPARPREGGVALVPPPPLVVAHEPAAPVFCIAVDDAGSELEDDLEYQYAGEHELERRDDVGALVAEAVEQASSAPSSSSASAASSGPSSSSTAASSSGAAPSSASSSGAAPSSTAASLSGAALVAVPLVPPPMMPLEGPPPPEALAADQPADAGVAVAADAAAAAALEHRPRARRAGRDGYPRLYVPGSADQVGIRLSDNADGTKDMRAICNVCSATLSRTCKLPPPGRAVPGSRLSGQGSPLGNLWAWAKKGLDLGPVHASAAHSAFVPDFEQRRSARSDVELLLPVSADWISAEREGAGAPGYPEPVQVP